MEELIRNNNFAWVILGMTLLLGIFIGILMEKAADKFFEKLGEILGRR